MNIIDQIKKIKYNRLSEEEKIIYNNLYNCYKLVLDKTYFINNNTVVLYVENNEMFILRTYYCIILKMCEFDKIKTLNILDEVVNNFLNNNNSDESHYPYPPKINRSDYIKL